MSHEQALHLGNLDAATSEEEEAVVLHLVEGTADIEATITHLVGKAGHQNLERLGTCGIYATLAEEADDALRQGGGIAVPGLAHELLSLGGIEVEQVEAEDEELVAEAHDFVLADGDKAAVVEGGEGVGEALVIAEDGFWLEHTGCLQLLDDGVGVVVGTALDAEGAGEEEIELRAGRILANDDLPYPTLHEAELGLSGNLSEVVATHALKQGEKQQLVVELQSETIYDLQFRYSAILGSSEGENQTAVVPSGLA